MAARVADINPQCDVRVIADFVSGDNVEAILGLRGTESETYWNGGGSGSGSGNGTEGESYWVGTGTGSGRGSGSGRRRRQRPDFVLDAIDDERAKAAVVGGQSSNHIRPSRLVSDSQPITVVPPATSVTSSQSEAVNVCMIPSPRWRPACTTACRSW
jgi:hypothetical protein